MTPGLSTHVFLPQRLHTGLLDAMHRSGARAIEIFAARHHFDYTDRAAVRELAAWFRDSGVTATLHQPLYKPLYADAQWSRHVAPNLNLIDPEKARRIDAMDEVKRALETAEQIPFRSVVLHLGMKDDRWDNRALEDSLTAIEHLKAFATPLGVQILLENLQNEITTPEHLLEIVRIGHFDSVGMCLDVGHGHLAGSEAGIDDAFEVLKDRIAELHLHDNGGTRDEHLWPATSAVDTVEGGIRWPNVYRHAATLPANTPGVLEIAYTLDETADSVRAKASAVFDGQRRWAEAPPEGAIS